MGVVIRDRLGFGDNLGHLLFHSSKVGKHHPTHRVLGPCPSPCPCLSHTTLCLNNKQENTGHLPAIYYVTLTVSIAT